jgi:hypothetical protein
MKYITLFLVLILSFNTQAKVILIKQWHFSAKVKTTNMAEAKKYPQFINQKDIYKYLEEKVKSKKIDMIISEGCEGEITSKFSFEHNGWSYKKLLTKVNDKHYEDIMALIPLKLKVKFNKDIQSLCGDSLPLMKKNALAFSELRGFASYAITLIKSKTKDPQKFELYKKSLLKDHKNPKKLDAISFAKLKASESLTEALFYINKRNDVFIEKIIQNKGSDMAVVIGGMHIKDLSEKLEKLKIPFEVYTPKGYQNLELKLLQTLNKFLK